VAIELANEQHWGVRFEEASAGMTPGDWTPRGTSYAGEDGPAEMRGVALRRTHGWA
jgi:hypothetical protein